MARYVYLPLILLQVIFFKIVTFKPAPGHRNEINTRLSNGRR